MEFAVEPPAAGADDSYLTTARQNQESAPWNRFSFLAAI